MTEQVKRYIVEYKSEEGIKLKLLIPAKNDKDAINKAIITINPKALKSKKLYEKIKNNTIIIPDESYTIKQKDIHRFIQVKKGGKK